MGLKRLSQAVTPVDAANADPNRYVYLTPENTEPSLGVPDGNGYILYSNTDGSRIFTEIGNLLIEGEGIIIDANGTISIDPNILVNVNLSANVDVTRTGFTRFEYITPNGQVLLTGTDIYGQDLDFSSNDQVMVYIDGFLLQPNVDYTYANGFGNANVTSALTLDTGTRENSIVSIHRISPTLFAQGPDGNASFSGSSDDIPEGTTNLFFTNARARAAVSAGTGLAYDEANGIFTANLTTTLVPEGANLYFTNARALSAVIDNISTSNVTEGANLYFTNTRAISSLTAGSGVVIQANGLIIADSATAFSGNTDAVPEGTANLYFTNARAITALTGENVSIMTNDAGYLTSVDLTTSNVTEGANLYFTNARVEAFILSNVTTSNVREGANLYFSNARAVAAVKDNINTSNVIEGSNLYYTNNRVNAAVSAFISTSNVREGANLYFTNTRAVGSLTAGENITIYANGLILSSADFGGALPTFYTSNIVEDGDVITGNVYFTNARARQALNAGFGLSYDNATGTFYFEESAVTTSNIAEGANLYFTNTRAVGALTAGQNITIYANGMIISTPTISGLPTFYTSNVIEDGNTTTGNVYFTNARARGAFTFGSGLTYNSVTGSLQANVRSVNGLTGIITLTTANIAEGGSNLYFSNTRAIQAFTAGPGIETANLANGILSTTTVVDEATVANVIENIDTVVIGNLIPAVASARNLGNSTHAWQELWVSGQTIRLGNLRLTEEDGFFKVVDQQGNVAFNADNIEETANTLFFTNARVYASLTAGNNISVADLANGKISSIFGNSNVIVAVNNFITTSNVKEGANLYFSNTRARRAFTAGSGIDAANLALGIITVDTSGSGLLSGYINASNVIETGNPTTGNVFFNNSRARAAFTAGPGINAANLATGTITANVLSVAGKQGVVLLYTPNIIEAGNTTVGNVYFTNTRARQAFTAGANIDAAKLANGIIEFSGVGGGSSNFTAANVLAGDGITVSTDVGGNVTVTNDGVVTLQSATDAANSITVVDNGDGDFTVAISPNVTVSGTLTAGNIVVGGRTIVGSTGVLNAFINASNVIETGSPTTGNVFFSNTRARRAFTAGSGIDAANLALGIISTNFAQLSLASTNTDSLPEGSANLYFTNQRAQDAVIGLDISLFTNDAGYLTASDPVIVDSADIFADMEAVNAGIGFGNVSFNPVSGTITYDRVSNANVVSALTGGTGINIDADGTISLTGDAAALFEGNTDSLPEGVNNLYYTNARVAAYLSDVGLEDLTVENITILGEIITNGTGGDIANINLISTVSIAANEWYGISTSNVVEGANLYYTNERAYANISSWISGGGLTTLLGGDAVTSNDVRTYFTATGSDGFTYNQSTGEFNIDPAEISTDIRNFVLANSASAGAVLLINTNGTVDPINSTNFDETRLIGVLKETGTAGQTKAVTMLGAVANSYVGLQAGSEYYVDKTTGAISSTASGSNYKLGVATDVNGILTYHKRAGRVSSAIDIVSVNNSGTGHGGIAFDGSTNELTYSRVTNSNIRTAITGSNPIAFNSSSGVISLNVGENLTVNVTGHLNGVASFVAQDAIDAVLPEIETVNNLTGHGNLSYNSSTGTFTLNRVTSANIRGEFSAAGGLTYNNGVYAVKVGENLEVNATNHLNVTALDAEAVAGAFSADNAGTGYGSLTYNNITGEFTYTRVTDADIRGRFSASSGINYDSSTGAFTADSVEIRQLISATNSGTGYGSITYDNGLGIINFNRITDTQIATSVQNSIDGGSITIDAGTTIDSTTDLQIKSLGVGVAATGTTGEIIATNDITAFYSSDERLKTNISVIDNALVKLDNIRGVSFDWNDTAKEMYPDRTEHDVGVIAQEIEQVLPEVVVDRDNGYKAVRYEKIIPLLIQAIKELKQEVDELKKNR